MKKNLIITLVLACAILFVNVPTEIYGESLKNRSDAVLSKYIGKDAEGVFKMIKNENKADLLKEFKRIEKSINLNNDMPVLIPFAVALVEKHDSFTDTEILSLIEDEETGPGLESVLIKIYSRNNGNKDELKNLLKNDKIDINTKKSIIGTNDFTAKELKGLFKDNDNDLAISAMKRLIIDDLEITSELAKEVLLNNRKTTDEKLIASYIGIGEYYRRNKTDKDKKAIVEKMKTDFKQSRNEVVKDNIIYSLAKMNDIDILKYIIYNIDIDKELKVSAIERNLTLLQKIILNDISVENLELILDTMKIHPIIEIGDELKKLTTNSVFSNDKKLIDTVSYIERNGIKGVFKYE